MASPTEAVASSANSAEHRSPISPEATRGALYLAARYGLGVMVGVGNMLVMTWWIGPHAYGLFVTAIGIVSILAILARLGIDTYLVRAAMDDDRLYGTAASLILLASFALTTLAVITVPLLIRWFGNREFVRPYLALLCVIPISALAGVPMARLERRLKFRLIAGIELAGQSWGLAIAAALAWLKAGVWAPVMGQIACQVVTLIATTARAAMPLRLHFDAKHARSMFSYGIGLTASLRAWQLRSLVNPLIVGRFLGAESVAYVALAIRIAESLGAIRQAAGRIAIAALARLQSRRDEFRSALERALFLQVITLGPLLCAFALLGPCIFHRVLGARWKPSLAIYPFVAFGVLVNSVYNLQASALFVVNKQWSVMRSYSAHVILLAATAMILLPHWGLIAYGWAEVIACAAYFIIHSAMAATAPISYKKIRPWVVGFAGGLFLVPAGYALLQLN